MPFFEVSVGHRIANTVMSRIREEGIPLEVYPEVVRIYRAIQGEDNTHFIVEAASEDSAIGWTEAIKNVLAEAEATEHEVSPDEDEPPEPLDVYAKVGTWTKTAGVSTTVITSLGLDSKPLKALFLWGTGVIGANSFNTYTTHAGQVVGFSDGTNHRCLESAVEDNNTTMNTNFWFGNKVFALSDATGSASTHHKEKATAGFDSDGFTLTWDGTTNNAAGGYLAIWGDDITDVQIRDFVTDTTSAGIHEYDLDLNSKPDFGFFLYAPWAGGSLPAFADTDAGPSISVNAGQSGVRNWFAHWISEDGIGTSSTERKKRTRRVLGGVWDNQALSEEAEFESWNDESIFLDWTPEPPEFNDSPCSAIFITGGKWDAGYFLQPSAGGTSPVGDVRSLLPDKHSVVKAVCVVSDGNIVNEGEGSNAHAKLSFGVTDGTNSVTTSIDDQDGAAVSVNTSITYNNKLMSTFTSAATASSSTEDSACTILDVATAGEFTVHYASSDGIPRQNLWFVLAA